MKGKVLGKKVIALGLSALMGMSLLACSNQEVVSDDKEIKDSNKVEKSGNEPITIQFWNSFTGADGDMLVELVNEFNETNEYGITVEMDISSDFDSQLSTAFAAGTGPDLVLFSSAYRFQYGDYMQTVGDIWESTELEKSDFMQSYLDYCSEGEELYLVPFQVVGYYMYWNKDLFEAAGLNPDAPPTNWDEWEEYARKITDAEKNVYGSGISYGYQYQIAHIMQRFGGLAVTDESGTWKANFAENDGYIEFLDMYKNMLDEGINPLEADTDSMASAGQIGLTIGGPWVTIGLDTAGINYGIGLIPQGEAGDMNSVEVLGFSVTTVASEEEKEAAYRFIEWWNTEDAEGSSPALEWSLANGFPAYTYSVAENAEYQSNSKLAAMSQANPEAPTDFIVDSSFPGINSVLSDVIPEMINSVAFGSESTEKSLEKAQETATKILEAYK